MQIRLIRETELWNAMNLCYRIFMQQVAPRYSPEGIKNFEDFLAFEKQLEWHRNQERFTFGAFEGSILCGVSQMDTDGHISLLFVETHRQKEGMGTALVYEMARMAQQRFGCKILTVNAAPSVAEAYVKMGFVQNAPAQCQGGIDFVPMFIETYKAIANGKMRPKDKKERLVLSIVLASVTVFLLFFTILAVGKEKEKVIKYWDQEMLPGDRLPYFGENMDPFYDFDDAEESDGIWDINLYEEKGLSYTIEEDHYQYNNYNEPSTGYYVEFEIDYPKIEGLEKGVQEKANQIFKECAMRTVLDYYEKPTEEGKEQMLGKEPFIASRVKYKVCYMGKEFLSVIFEDQRYIGNMYVGSYDLRSVMLNLESGEVYTLDKILNVDKSFAKMWRNEVFSEYSKIDFIADMDNKMLEKVFQGQEVSARPVCFVTEDGLEIGISYSDEEGNGGYVTMDFEKEDLKEYLRDSAFWDMPETLR